MITLTETYTPSEHVKRRSDAMWAVKTKTVGGRVTYRVTPYGASFDHHHKSKRIVTIDLEAGTAECIDRFTGEVCEANADFVPGRPDVPKTLRMCSHVYSVLRRLEINSRKAAA